MNAARWNLAISADTDQSVRLFLASQGGGRKGDLSKFIEKAVRAYIFNTSLDSVKSNTANFSEAELNALSEDAVAWARAA